jgi:hypothetical protein
MAQDRMLIKYLTERYNNAVRDMGLFAALLAEAQELEKLETEKLKEQASLNKSFLHLVKPPKSTNSN